MDWVHVGARECWSGVCADSHALEEVLPGRGQGCVAQASCHPLPLRRVLCLCVPTPMNINRAHYLQQHLCTVFSMVLHFLQSSKLKKRSQVPHRMASCINCQEREAMRFPSSSGKLLLNISPLNLRMCMQPQAKQVKAEILSQQTKFCAVSTTG